MIWKLRNGEMSEATISNVESFVENNRYIAVDTETTGFDPHTKDLLSIQIGNPHIQYVIDCSNENILFLKPYLLDNSKVWLFHNYKFDGKWLIKSLGIQPINVYDTFLAECILFTGYNFKDSDKPFYVDTSLKGVCKKYLNVELDKSVRGKINYLGLNEEVIKYAGADVEHLELVMEHQMESIKTLKLENVLDLECNVVKVLTLMEYTGISIDTDSWIKVSDIAENNVKNIIERLDNVVVNSSKNIKSLSKYINNQYNLFGFEERLTFINWASSAQKKEILNILGIKVDDVSDETLQKLKQNDIVVDLIDLSKNLKLSTSFGKGFLKFINPVTNRVHANHWQLLSTGRMSMDNPNLQQIPAHGKLAEAIKESFIASEGYDIVAGDYSGFELRIIAEFSKDPVWVNIFLNDKDLHSELCSLTFNLPLDKVNDPFPEKPSITYRFLQKTLNFGLCYGMSEYKFSNTAQISVDMAKSIIKRFFNSVPKVKEFLDMLGNLGKKNGYIRTDPYFKRIRWFPEKNEEDFKIMGSIERAAKNTVPQGVNASITKKALIMLQERIDRDSLPVRILLTIHDSIVTEARKDFSAEWKEILNNTMIEAAKLVIKTIPVKVDCYIADKWKK